MLRYLTPWRTITQPYSVTTASTDRGSRPRQRDGPRDQCRVHPLAETGDGPCPSPDDSCPTGNLLIVALSESGELIHNAGVLSLEPGDQACMTAGHAFRLRSRPGQDPLVTQMIWMPGISVEE